MKRWSWKRPALACALLLAVAGCSSADSSTPVLAEGLQALPATTAVAWVTYADHLVKIHVDTEKRLKPTPDEVKAGEGMIPREISATVTQTLWSRPGTTATVPESVVWTSGGWIFHGKREQRIQVDNTAWLEPGHDYLAPVSFTALSPGGTREPSWIPLGSKNVMPYDDNVIGIGEVIKIGGSAYTGNNPEGDTPLRDSVWGKNGTDLAAVLASTSIDPAAKPYMDLSPIDRYAAVVRTTEKGDVPPGQGPGIPTISPATQPS